LTANREAGLCQLAKRQGLSTLVFARSERSLRLIAQAWQQKSERLSLSLGVSICLSQMKKTP
jgi:hypothetical protein